MTQPVCAVVGIGPGNGASMARTFHAAGYKVAALSRSPGTRDALAAELDGAISVRCDAGDPESVTAALDEVHQTLGPVEVLLWNAGSGAWGTLEETTAEQFETAWRINALGLMTAAKIVQPHMEANERGAIIVSGATASLRGGARFTAFASAKAAQRSLCQSMARHLWPRGVHVALLILDGMVLSERTRQWAPEGAPDHAFLQPDDIAACALATVNQPRAAWTFEITLRPSLEKW